MTVEASHPTNPTGYNGIRYRGVDIDGGRWELPEPR